MMRMVDGMPMAVPQLATVLAYLKSLMANFFVLFLTKEAYSHGWLQTGKLGQTPMMTMVDGMPMAVPQLATIQAHL